MVLGVGDAKVSDPIAEPINSLAGTELVCILGSHLAHYIGSETLSLG